MILIFYGFWHFFIPEFSNIKICHRAGTFLLDFSVALPSSLGERNILFTSLSAINHIETETYIQR